MNHRKKGKEADTEKNMFIPLYIKKQNKTKKKKKKKKKKRVQSRIQTRTLGQRRLHLTTYVLHY